ncbi:TPA: hypothetical protein HA251_01170 [Candidatus Woesearchaeota archaeon]|nr:hypothetical protein [Candidatus Woesearchaeota archaeon]
MIDKILSPLILIVTVAFLGIIMYVSVFSGIESGATLNRQRYEQEHGALLIQSVMMAQENESGSTYETLLVRALREVNTTILIDGQEIDVEREYAEVLDELLGSGNYYLEIRPLLQGVTVSYVLDGSDTMKAKRDTINASLPSLIGSLREIFGENSTVNTHVYILKQFDSETHCGEFYTPSGPNVKATCEDIGGSSLYRFLQSRGMSPPAPAPLRTYSEWTAASHIASVYDFSQSDWASGVMYASIKHTEDLDAAMATNKHIIVTVADELSTSSKADECFGIKPYPPPEPSWVAGNDLLFCYLCNDNCPANRSFSIVNQSARILAANGDLFIGFTSFPCDYQYDRALDEFGVTNYSCKYLDDDVVACDQYRAPAGGGGGSGGIIGGGIIGGGEPVATHPPADANWCLQDSCGACNPAPDDPNPADPSNYCFHRNCDEIIRSHLLNVSDATGGSVLPLTDLSQLTGVVENYFQGLVEAFDFRIGQRDPARDRYAVTKDIAFPGGDRVRVTLWIYDAEVLSE